MGEFCLFDDACIAVRLPSESPLNLPRIILVQRKIPERSLPD